MSVILPGNWVTHANVYPRKKKLADGSSVIERHGVEWLTDSSVFDDAPDRGEDG